MILYAQTKEGLEKVIKRDGRRVSFDKRKITQAIKKAFVAVGELCTDEYVAKLSSFVADEAYFRYNYSPTVEQIQDIVEETLIANNHPHVAKAYILYRAERSRVREMKTRLMKTYEDITFSEAKDSDTKRENANVNGDTAMGIMLKYGSEGAKQFFRMFVLNPEHSKAHTEGDIHIHDMDFFAMTTTCCQIDLIKLFSGGFGTGHGYLREPSEISSYAALACIAIQSNQNDQHGGQSVPNFDYALAIGVKKTFVKRYSLNLARVLEAYTDRENLDYLMNKIRISITESGVAFSMGEYEQYFLHEKDALVQEGFAPEYIEKAQTKALERAFNETDRATFQSMEALVHNLNTMNSRAGAQTPFSSINYGTDCSPEGRAVIKNILLALEA
jgi:ribonucleoside-triphosphate reductase